MAQLTRKLKNSILSDGTPITEYLHIKSHMKPYFDKVIGIWVLREKMENKELMGLRELMCAYEEFLHGCAEQIHLPIERQRVDILQELLSAIHQVQLDRIGHRSKIEVNTTTKFFKLWNFNELESSESRSLNITGASIWSNSEVD